MGGYRLDVPEPVGAVPPSSGLGPDLPRRTGNISRGEMAQVFGTILEHSP